MFTRLLRISLWTASVAAAAAFTTAAVRRILGAGALDPIEGALLDHATRIAQQGPFYIEPVDPSMPALMPGFPLLVSLLPPSFCAGLWGPRLLTLLAVLGAASLVIWIARTETESWTVAVASGGLMFAGYGLLGGAVGVARPEALMLLLVLGGYAALRFSRGVMGALLAVALLAAACATQLTAVWFTAAAGAALVFDDGKKRLITFMIGAVMLLAGGYAALSALWGPWFNDAAWNGPVRALQFDAPRFLHYASDALLGKLGVLTLTVVLSFALPTPPWRGRSGLWLFLGIAMISAGLLATQSARVGPQAMIPTVAVLALIGPLSMQRVMQHLSTWPGSSRLGGQGVVLAGLALQFFMLLSSLPPSLF